jgi:hypothetical protein
MIIALACRNLLELAFANKVARIRTLSRAYDLIDNKRPCGAG